MATNTTTTMARYASLRPLVNAAISPASLSADTSASDGA